MAAPHCLHEGLRLAQNPSRLRLLLESKHQPRSGADSLATMGGKAPGRASRSSMVSWPWLYYLAKERFRVVAIGRNLTRVISSVTSVKTTSTGVPTSMSSILHCNDVRWLRKNQAFVLVQTFGKLCDVRQIKQCDLWLNHKITLARIPAYSSIVRT